MSLVVATNGYMICDSFLGNEEVQYQAGKKIFIQDHIAVGVVGSLSAARDIEKMLPDLDDTPGKLCDYFAKHIEAEYQVLVSDGQELWESNEAGDTFKIYPRANKPAYGAIGQGYMYALGALFTGSSVRQAMLAASYYSPMVSEPYLGTAFLLDRWGPLRNIQTFEDYSE